MGNTNGDDYRLDEIDRQIIHTLMTDARNTSAPTIADPVNVSPGTIRNRIDRLENHGIIRGYTAQIDFDRAADHLTYLYIYSVPPAQLTAATRDARTVPGVINARKLLGAAENLHVTAVGEDGDDHDRIVSELVDHGAEVNDERLVRDESFEPYAPFGPDGELPAWEPADFVRLAGGANVVEVTVAEDAPCVGCTLAEAAAKRLIDDEALVVAIERDGRVLTPHGETEFQRDDIVTLLSRGEHLENTLGAFSDEVSSSM